MPKVTTYISDNTEVSIAAQISSAISECSLRFGIEEELIRAFIQKESDGVATAMRYEPQLRRAKWYKNTLPKDELDNDFAYYSIGLMQTLWGIARSYGFKGSPFDMIDPKVSIYYGCKHLSVLMKKYRSLSDAISSYNQGSPRKDKETGLYLNQGYVDFVLRYYRKIKKSGTATS